MTVYCLDVFTRLKTTNHCLTYVKGTRKIYRTVLPFHDLLFHTFHAGEEHFLLELTFGDLKGKFLIDFHTIRVLRHYYRLGACECVVTFIWQQRNLHKRRAQCISVQKNICFHTQQVTISKTTDIIKPNHQLSNIHKHRKSQKK